MAKTKGFCVLQIKGEANSPVAGLTLNKRYGFEKEEIKTPTYNGFGYTIITGATPIKLKGESFEKYFVEEETAAQAAKPDASKATFNGPKNDQAQAGAAKPDVVKEKCEVKGVLIDLTGWDYIKELINSITLTPNKGMIDVVVNVKPDIDMTLSDTPQRVMANLINDLKELNSVSAKVKDLTKIIDERIAAEKKRAEEAKKEKPKETAKPAAKKPTETKKPVDTTPANDLFNQNAETAENQGGDFEETPAGAVDETEEQWD